MRFVDLDLDLQPELHPPEDQDREAHLNLFQLTWTNLKNGNGKDQTNRPISGNNWYQ